MTSPHSVSGVEVTQWDDSYATVLTTHALEVLVTVQRRFAQRRRDLLEQRAKRAAELSSGQMPDFLDHTAVIRDSDWHVALPPPDLVDRRVEITGPTSRKLVINALNSGARVFMADFEDSTTPTFDNLVTGQANLRDALRNQIDFTSADGKRYELQREHATLMVRPRGWHLPERHVLVDSEPVSAGLFDACIYLVTSARYALDAGSGPYFYLPKLESHLEARLWNEVFLLVQEMLGIPRGTIRATVLIETVLAAFEMDEILFELREHSVGLNAGRWDYIFSMIKKFGLLGQAFQLPDRAAVTMSVPFMRAYTDLLVRTCHQRGAHAIGGMSAFIPERGNQRINEIALDAVRADKEREAGDGFDGSWVAHPDLVPVAREVFDRRLGTRPNQIDRQRPEVSVSAAQLVDIGSTPGEITETGLRTNIRVGIQYLQSWLGGVGAVGISHLMEDMATAEICRSQVWQWVRNGARTEKGDVISPELVRRLADEEVAAVAGEEAVNSDHYARARTLFEDVALSQDFVEFLGLEAYNLLG